MAVVERFGADAFAAFIGAGLRMRFAFGAGVAGSVAGAASRGLPLLVAAGFTTRFAVVFLVVVVVGFPISSCLFGRFALGRSALRRLGERGGQ